MSSVLPTSYMTSLETMVDECSLFEVLVALDVICGDKAAHIRANGGPGDASLALRWERAGATLAKCAQRKAITTLP